ncbi:MAG: hypothetical protein RKU31_01905 [Deltaproteobacteria bacterium]|jgi:transcriptional regulator with XRE-family HTH domain
MPKSKNTPDGLRHLDPVAAMEQVKQHFSGRPADAVIETTHRLLPPGARTTTTTAENLDLFERPIAPTRIPLTGYLACALSDLGNESRDFLFHLSDIVSVICREHDIDVYEPRKNTDPVHHGDVSDVEVFKTDRERVLQSDVLIHLCHYPSTGSGQELDFAYTALLPIILIRKSEKRASRMVTGIPSLKIELAYVEPEELRESLRSALAAIRPLLEERKLAFGAYDKNIVGSRIRETREALGVRRSELAEATGFTEEGIAHAETLPDRLSNLSLLQLRRIAAALHITAAELLSPDISELVVQEVINWVDGRKAARSFSGLSRRDRNKLVRRILYRVMDQLEREDG